jgi:hypothetical protein
MAAKAINKTLEMQYATPYFRVRLIPRAFDSQSLDSKNLGR